MQNKYANNTSKSINMQITNIENAQRWSSPVYVPNLVNPYILTWDMNPSWTQILCMIT